MNHKWHRHIGVYGICMNSDKSKLLLIKKGKGPYKGLYDLPGGGIKKNERIEDALRREMIEETGIEVESYKGLGVYDFLVEFEYLDTNFTHHIACFYLIGNFIEDSYSYTISEVLNDGVDSELNDAKGLEFVDIKNIGKDNASPLVLKTLEIL